MRTQYSVLAGLIVAGAMGLAHAVDVTRLNNPAYQESLSNLNEADHALRQAIEKVRSSSKSPVANVDYRRMLADLQAMQATLVKVIEPHTYADKHRVLKPDSIYFLPPELTPGAAKK